MFGYRKVVGKEKKMLKKNYFFIFGFIAKNTKKKG